MRLNGKVAIVTGGARGIGRAIAHRYLQEGARCVLADIDAEGARRTAAELDRERCHGIRLDVTRQEEIDAAVAETVRRAGRIDILVNNAGTFDLKPCLEVDRASWDRVLEVNLTGAFFVLQAVARQMVAQGGGGKVINLASQAGRYGIAMVTAYCVAKAGVISMTQSTALELIKRGINVNAISPGVVDTEFWNVADALFAKHQNMPPGEKKRQVGQAVPYGRMGTPADLVGAAVFLASADADYVVGQTLNVDGGNRLN